MRLVLHVRALSAAPACMQSNIIIFDARELLLVRDEVMAQDVACRMCASGVTASGVAGRQDTGTSRRLPRQRFMYRTA